MFSRNMSSLGVFALLQCVLFVLIGNYILEIRGMFWIDLGIMFMTAMGGVAARAGRFLYCVSDPKTAANIVPLVLIPQIIMGGALIKYEDMNRNLALVYYVHSLVLRASEQGTRQKNGQQIAGAVHLPVHRHALVLRGNDCGAGQAESGDRRQDRTQREIDRIVAHQ